jgi:hypothetical protein
MGNDLQSTCNDERKLSIVDIDNLIDDMHVQESEEALMIIPSTTASKLKQLLKFREAKDMNINGCINLIKQRTGLTRSMQVFAKNYK